MVHSSVSHEPARAHNPRLDAAMLCLSLGIMTLVALMALRSPLPGVAITAPREARVVAWNSVPQLPVPLAQFATVFWEPRDTDSLRERIVDQGLHGKTVLEIGTGTGLIALTCLAAGAERVVATDINPYALANARFNAERLGVADRLELRRVAPQRPEAFAALAPGERFDLIVSNPPWEEGRPAELADFALYDPGFHLLESIVAGGEQRLRPGGRIWLAYGCVAAIQELEALARTHGRQVTRLDPRPLTELPPVFLPGMLLEIGR